MKKNDNSAEFEDPVRESRRVAAKVLMEVVRKSEAVLHLEGHPVPIHRLMGDQQVVAALMKIGLFSVGAQSFADMRMESFGGRTAAPPMASVPVSLIAMAFNYAMKVVGPEATKDSLRKDAAKIERAFGAISLDPILMSEISALATQQERG